MLLWPGRRSRFPPGRRGATVRRMLADALSDPRAYLQQRIALFSGLACVFFTGLLALDFAGGAEGEATFSSTRVAPLVVLSASGLVWLATRRGERSRVMLRALELSLLAAAAGVYATLPLVPPVPGHGGLMAMFAPVPMAVMVLLRAAIIPSPPWLSAVVGVAWGALMTTANVFGWEGVEFTFTGEIIHTPEVGRVEPWAFPLGLGVLTTLAFSFVAGVISHVVYGLQTRVRDAMQLGQYTLQAKLGEGGMGVVYRARHGMLRRPTAIKLLPPDRAEADAVARFEREVQRTAQLTHPNTVTVFDYGRTHDGTFYYAMELLEGATLRQVVASDGPMPAARVVHVATQIAGSLREAHGLGLIHRDIKPENIMLCAQGGAPDVAKVLDFGLVKSVHGEDAGLTQAGLVGTPRYLAPEVMTTPDEADGRADVYALGAVMYYLLAGVDVFEGRTTMEVCAHHLNSPPLPPSTKLGGPVPPTLEALVLDCLAKDPARRPGIEGVVEGLAACRVEVGAWTEAEARAWWGGPGAVVRATAGDGSDLGEAVTIAVDAHRTG